MKIYLWKIILHDLQQSLGPKSKFKSKSFKYNLPALEAITLIKDNSNCCCVAKSASTYLLVKNGGFHLVKIPILDHKQGFEQH